jgi:hypothetical protein
MQFDPQEYDDNKLVSAIYGLRQLKQLKERRWSHLGTWPMKRLAVLEREAAKRNLKLKKHEPKKP